MLIKVFNYSEGWYDVEVDSIDDVLEILEDDDTRLPEDDEIDHSHRDHMWTMEELEGKLCGFTIFSLEFKGRTLNRWNNILEDE